MDRSIIWVFIAVYLLGNVSMLFMIFNSSADNEVTTKTMDSTMVVLEAKVELLKQQVMALDSAIIDIDSIKRKKYINVDSLLRVQFTPVIDEDSLVRLGLNNTDLIR